MRCVVDDEIERPVELGQQDHVELVDIGLVDPVVGANTGTQTPASDELLVRARRRSMIDADQLPRLRQLRADATLAPSYMPTSIIASGATSRSNCSYHSTCQQRLDAEAVGGRREATGDGTTDVLDVHDRERVVAAPVITAAS